LFRLCIKQKNKRIKFSSNISLHCVKLTKITKTKKNVVSQTHFVQYSKWTKFEEVWKIKIRLHFLYLNPKIKIFRRLKLFGDSLAKFFLLSTCILCFRRIFETLSTMLLIFGKHTERFCTPPDTYLLKFSIPHSLVVKARSLNFYCKISHSDAWMMVRDCDL
jgi:hypothetical protein